MEYYSVIRRWINLEDIMLCEINQSQNDKYCICEIFHGQPHRNRDSKRQEEAGVKPGGQAKLFNNTGEKI